MIYTIFLPHLIAGVDDNRTVDKIKWRDQCSESCSTCSVHMLQYLVTGKVGIKIWVNLPKLFKIPYLLC